MALSSTADRDDVPAGACSPLELLHPAGCASRTRVVGSACTPLLCPTGTEREVGRADVVIVSPDSAEASDPAWRARAVAALGAALAPGGMGYVTGPRWLIRRIAAGLAAGLPDARLEIGPGFIQFPSASGRADGHLVPDDGRLLRYAGSHLVGAGPGMRRVAAAFGIGGVGPLVMRLVGRSGLLIRRAGGPPLLNWLATDGAAPAAAVIRTKWRAPGGSAVLFCFRQGDSSPRSIAKVPLSDALAWRTEREAVALATLGPSADRAGARVPGARLLRSVSGRPALVLDALEGRQAAALLRRRRIGPAAVAGQLAAWLEAWNRATAAVSRLDSAWLRAELLDGAERLAPQLRDGAGYVAWLRDVARDAEGQRLPRVATHNDLTMRNVLLERGARPAVLDWEAARGDGLPLGDFFYAVVDAATRARPDGNRQAAFVSCFGPEGAMAPTVWAMAERIRRATDVPHAVLVVAFHACWVQHATNELAKRPGTRTGPFFRIVELLARGGIEVPVGSAP